MMQFDSVESLFSFSRPPYLVLLFSGLPESPEMGRRYDLAGKEEWILGSDLKDDIQLDSSVASRKHARLYLRDGNWYITNLSPTRETYSNQLLVSEHRLRDGDLLTIGKSLFKFFSGVGPNAVYDEENYRSSTIDPLTGVYNRGFFDQSFVREYKRCHRQKQPLSLVMFDFDDFKQKNKQYGHPGGDEVLRQITRRVLSARVRIDEIFARFGGEEFVLILPRATKEQSQQIAEQICALVNSEPVYYKEHQIQITISVGVATLEPAQMKLGLDEKELLRKTNFNMYQAKNSGKNRVSS